jgi:hypothetical protein
MKTINFIFWRPYENEGYYISSHGKVYSSKSKSVLKPYISNGYEEVYIYKNKKRKHKRINRLVAEIFIPNPNNKLCVNHIDGNKRNNDISNLEWCTHKENTNHADNNGLIKRRLGGYKHKQTFDVDFKDAKIIIKHPQYFIFKDGRVYSTKTNIFMEPYKPLDNYIYYNIEGKTKPIHRLVAEHFISNPCNKSQVNHIDGNTTNNDISNLEWCTPKENSLHSAKNIIDYSKNWKGVIKYNLNQEELERYSSIKEAIIKNNIKTNSISFCCKGKRRSCGGFLWRYDNDPYEKALFEGAKIYNSLYLILPDKRLYAIKNKNFRRVQVEKVTERKYYLIQINGKRDKLYLDTINEK